MLGLNADHGDSSWQDLDFYFYCHPLSRTSGATGATGTLVYYSDPTSGPEDVDLGVYSSSDVFQIQLSAGSGVPGQGADAGLVEYRFVHTYSRHKLFPRHGSDRLLVIAQDERRSYSHKHGRTHASAVR